MTMRCRQKYYWNKAAMSINRNTQILTVNNLWGLRPSIQMSAPNPLCYWKGGEWISRPLRNECLKRWICCLYIPTRHRPHFTWNVEISKRASSIRNWPEHKKLKLPWWKMGAYNQPLVRRTARQTTFLKRSTISYEELLSLCDRIGICPCISKLLLHLVRDGAAKYCISCVYKVNGIVGKPAKLSEYSVKEFCPPLPINKINK